MCIEAAILIKSIKARSTIFDIRMHIDNGSSVSIVSKIVNVLDLQFQCRIFRTENNMSDG